MVQMKMRNKFCKFTSIIAAGMAIAATPTLSNANDFRPYVDTTLGTQWDASTESMQPSNINKIVDASEIKSINLAFITAEGGNSCKAAWGGYSMYEAGDTNRSFAYPAIKQLKSKNINFTISFGGAAGTYLAQVCSSPADLAQQYKNIIKDYSPDAIDFDIENDMQTNTQQLANLIQALNKVHSEYPDIKISFTLAVMPSGLANGINVIKQAKENNANFDFNINIMAMDYGPSFTGNMAEYAISAASSTLMQAQEYFPNMSMKNISITPMIGVNDTQPLNFSTDDAKKLTSWAKSNNSGWLSMWSINRDHPCEGSYVDNTCSSSNPNKQSANQSKDYEYSKIFMS